MQILFNMYMEAKIAFSAAVLRYQQDRSDLQFHRLMGEAELVLAIYSREYRNAWRDASNQEQTEFPNPDSIE